MFASICGTFPGDDKSKVNHFKICMVYSVKLEFEMALYHK